ncbi:MAG: acyl-CoA synthetase [Actinobacteria bacterium]|jgi:long-chain acyl-CoA synthetase|nr:MAG: acyl-CoA synthetase [Actinomycetota bacterium]
MEKNFKCWPEGVFKNLTYPEVPIQQILRSAALQWPWRNAIIFGGMEITFQELDTLSDRFATALASMGVKKGDRVGIHLPNCPQFAIAYYGLLKAGAVFVPMSPLLAEREIDFELNDADVETFIGLDMLFAVPQQVIPNSPVKRTIIVSLADCYPPLSAPVKMLQKQPVPEGTIDFVSMVTDYPAEPPQVEFNVKEDLAHIAYTGGTTGTPKGVMVTHYNGVANCCQFAYWFGGGDIVFEDGMFKVKRMEGDRDEDHAVGQGKEISLIVVPWFHAMGAIGYLSMQLLGGNTLVVFPRFDPTEYLQAIPKYRATVFGGAPQLFIPLVENPLFQDTDLSGIRMVASGAAPIPHHLLETLTDKIPGVICEAYGLSECTMGCCANPPSREGFRLGSVGLPIQDTEIRIMEAEEGKEEVPVGEIGEICIKGPQVMQGYWNKPEETAQVLRGGWLYTGDIGRFDEDGYLYIVDRKKDMLIYKGYNVYPRDLEDVINEHPMVAQSAVVGKYDESKGDIPIAFVELVPGGSISEEELLEYANGRLAAYKKIRVVKIVEALPASGAGKILRRELRDQAQDFEL